MTQKYGTLSQLGVEPGKLAKDLRLSEGKWCLSALSNVPFITVTIQDSPKVFTWGELIEIPSGCMGQVINSSKHKGDIYVNSGWDFSNKPKRITVPTPLVFFDISTGAESDYTVPPVVYPFTATTKYSIDTRNAVRAYLYLDITFQTPEGGFPQVDFAIIGQPNTTSLNTYNLASIFAGSALPKTGYACNYTLLSATKGAVIPLGFNAQAAECCNAPQALLDYAQVFWQIDTSDRIATNPYYPAAFYVVEY